MEHENNNKSWYAAKVFFNRMEPVELQLQLDDVKYYAPKDVIGSLIFVYATENYVALLREQHFRQLWFYTDVLTHKLSVIPNREMEIFIFVTSSGEKGLIYLGDDKPEYHKGDKVRVIEGPFKGVEGHIKRIKKDRRLIVSLQGVAAIATSFIHPDFLQKIEE